jgi:predicted dehydrogenase
MRMSTYSRVHPRPRPRQVCLKMRIGLVGAGRVASTHAAVLGRSPGVEIVAVADPRVGAAEHLASEVGARAFHSLSQALTEIALDAVDIVAPHDLHHRLATEALQSGVHVFMDKPIAADVAQARDICELASRRRLVLAVCHNLLFHPALHRGVELVRSGVLGRPTRAEAWSTGWLDLPPWDFRRDRLATGGGAWVDGAPHLVYVLEELLGPIGKLLATAGRAPSRLGGEDTAVGHASFTSGAVATVTVGYSDCPAGPDVEWPEGWGLGVNLIGTEGRVLVDFLPSAQVLWRCKGAAERVEALTDVAFDVGFGGAFADFVAAVEGSRALRVSPWDSLHNLELVRSAIGR